MPRALQSFRVGKVHGYLRNKVWYLCYHELGTRRRPRVGPDRNTAKQLASQINAQLEVGAPTALSFKAITIPELRQRWLDHHEHVLRSSVHTIRRYRAATEHLLRFLTTQPIRHASHFQVRHAEEFVRHLRSIKVSPNGHKNTKNRALLDKGVQYILECCRTLFTFAAKRRHLPPYADNPFAALEIDRIPIETARPIELLTEEQERAFLAACDDWQFPVFLTLMLTGLRPGEICHLLLSEDLDLEAGTVRVRNKRELGWQVKTRNERDVPLVPVLAAILKAHLAGRRHGPVFVRRKWDPSRCQFDATTRAAVQNELSRRIDVHVATTGQPISRTDRLRLARQVWWDIGAVKEDRVRTEFMRLTRSIGLPHCTAPKVLRHMFATTLQDGRVDPLIRNLLMGHASAEQRSACYGLGMTAVYSHSRPETIRKQLEGALAMRCAVAVANELAGGFGNDNLQGGANADTIHGDVGDDAIHGHTGDDVLYGDADADKLFGGDGMDILHGGIGNDSLVSIDNTTSDALFGEAGLDSFWADEITSPVIFADGMPDISPEESGTNVHRVRRFVNGADRTLNGDAIADPRDETNYGSFRMNPLFASTGPSENDVNQGSIGDCWLLAPLAGIARADQNAIHQIIADMGDGTYAVRLGGNYYRVDADLPVLDFVSMNLEYARVGQENCIWVPLVEKAYAHFRTGANTYASLDRGWETEALRGLNATDIHQRFVGTDRDDLDEGRTYLRSLLGTLESRMATGTVVTVAFMSIEFMCPCENEHAYTLVAVNRDDVGRIVSVTLRNPWGYDGGPEDVPDDSDPSDGLVTVTIGQMLHSDTYVSWGDVG